MNAKEIRGALPHLEQEHILNVFYQSGEQYGVLAMLAKDEEGVVLWEICKEPEETQKNQRKYRIPRTNREASKSHFQNGSPFIHSLKIGDTSLSVSSASGTCIGEEFNQQEKILLVYLLSKGLKLGKLEEEPLDRLRMNCYQMSEKELPQRLSGADIEVTLSEDHTAVPINKKIRLKTGEYKKPRIIKINSGEELTVYIHGVSFYDIWKEAEAGFQDERLTQRFTEEEIAKVKQEYFENLSSMYPKGYVLPMVEYECDKDYQIQFYTTEYLRRKPENKSASIFFHVRSDKEKGPMGFRNRACPLEAVEKGYEGSIDVEIFLYYKVFPEKTMVCRKVH